MWGLYLSDLLDLDIANNDTSAATVLIVVCVVILSLRLLYDLIGW